MIVQLKIEDKQSDFLLNLLYQLKDSVSDIKIINSKKGITLKENAEDTYFEIRDDSGVIHKVQNWKDGEFERMGLISFFKDEDKISAEELFDV